MPPTPPLPPAIATLVEELREPQECIWLVQATGPQELVVLLIDERQFAKATHVQEVLGLSWGQGRVLKFTSAAGQWLFESESRWIS